MKVFRSNRAEVLAEALCTVLQRPVGGPMDEELVVVHSPGMRRWLQMRIAERVGICANVRFPTPGTLLSEVFAAVSGLEREDLEAWSVDRMQWAVLAALPELLDEPELAPVRAYLKGDPDQRMRLQLARRIAETFGRYQSYRLELVRRWTSPAGAAEPGWQPRLFRALAERALHPVSGQPIPHMGELAPRFFETLAAAEGPVSGVPERICLFGISTLAPVTVEVLRALGQHHEVFLFVLAPTQEWSADSGRRGQLGLGLEELADPGAGGHPLVTAMGKLGRDFQWVLEQHGPGYEESVGRALFVDPTEDRGEEEGPPPLLHQLQADILHLRGRGLGGVPRGLVDPRDRSVRLHACHGPMRQVEVLHDELLRLFEEIPDLRPRDVVVQCPDLPTFAPLVEAVFSRRPDAPGPPPIPFRLADRALRRENPVAEAVLAVLELARGRLPASAVLDLLALPPVAARAGLDASDLDTVREWVREAGVRWGRDAGHREAEGQPTYGENTWRFGLDRLLVGTSMRGEGLRTFSGVLPYDEIEGGTGELLGRLVGFWAALERCLRDLDADLSPEGWRARVNRILELLLSWDEDTTWQAQQVREAVDRLAQDAAGAGYEGAFGLPVILDLLAARFEGRGGSAGFLSGGVTVCAMVPLRAIPFRVVVLLGLDDGAYPRRDPSLGFDLTAQDRRRGDRSPREEDRSLFLESILSARDCLVVSWTGRSVQTNEALPPAVPVGELTDTLLQGYRLVGALEGDPVPDDPEGALHDEDSAVAALRGALLTEHPLQPFSPRAYTPDPRRQSFEPLYLAAARSMLGMRRPAPPFVERPLPAPAAAAASPGVEAGAAESGPRVLALDDLAAFLVEPVKWLLNRRLGVWLREESLSLEDREPAELDHLQRYQLGTVLLERALQGHDLDDAYELARAAGVLPPGTPGRTLFQELRDTVRPIATRTLARRSVGLAEPVDIDLDLGELRLVGRVGSRTLEGPVLARAGKVKGKQLLGMWVRHLALNAAGHAEQSWHLGRGAKGEPPSEVGLRPVAEARRHLRELVALFEAGQDRPLPLFSQASAAYAETLHEDPESPEQLDKAVKEARRAWTTTDYFRGDDAEPHIQRVFGGTEPFCPGWDPDLLELPLELRHDALARRVWFPLLDHRLEGP